MEKKISPAHAGTGFGPKKLKSAIKKNPQPPLSHYLKKFFMTPPPSSEIFYDPPLVAPKSFFTYGSSWCLANF